MKIAVVDDERPARSELIYLLQQCEPGATLLEANSGEQLLSLLENEAPDICFLDINLGGMNGTTLASLVKSRCPNTVIVFATAYEQYAVKAFDLGAVDYLLKPFDLERVRKALERAKKSQTTASRERLLIQGPKSMQVLNVRDIVFIETENRSCRIYTARECFEQNESLAHYEKRLADWDFFRIHKSYLVNLAYVKELVPSYNSGYAVVLKHYEKHPLPVGRQQIKTLRQMFE